MEAEAETTERPPPPPTPRRAPASPVRSAAKDAAAPATPAAPPTPAPARAAEAPAGRPAAAKRGYLVVGVVALTILAGAGGYVLVTAGEETTDDAQVAADVVPVGTRVSGQIVKVNIEENQLGKKGDVPAESDSADYAARARQAEAEVAPAAAQTAPARAREQGV